MKELKSVPPRTNKVLLGFMLAANLFVQVLIQGAFASADEFTRDECISTDEPSYALALEAKKRYESQLTQISGVLAVTAETCSENESHGVSPTHWECGVFVWFKDHDSREIFHQTTSLWQGRLVIDGLENKTVPICSKRASVPY